MQQLRRVGGLFSRLIIPNRRELLYPPRPRPPQPAPARERLRQLIAEGHVRSQADAVRLSRQNVSQIVKRTGFELERARQRCRRPAVCQVCHKRNTPGVLSGDGICAECNQAMKRVTLTCEVCGAKKTLPLSVAARLKTSLCRKCWVRERSLPPKGTEPVSF